MTPFRYYGSTITWILIPSTDKWGEIPEMEVSYVELDDLQKKTIVSSYVYIPCNGTITSPSWVSRKEISVKGELED